MSAIQLWTKNRSLARKVAGAYFIPGSSREDVIQEAQIALWEAAQDFDPEKGCSFRTFANLVIERQLLDCVKAAGRIKNRFLTEALRDEDIASLPHLHQVTDRCEERDDLRRLVGAINDLSPWERECVIGIASGRSYLEIGSRKQVDNGLLRARRKLRKAMA